MIRRIILIAACTFVVVVAGCTHSSRPATSAPATMPTTTWSDHDEIIINLLQRFDFGDGTLADMSDQEFEEMIRSDEDFKSKFDENASDAHIIALFREARRRALEESSAPPPTTFKSSR